jgi:hypothetical protein
MRGSEMKRLQVRVAVKDLASGARFYSTLFDAKPSALKCGTAYNTLAAACQVEGEVVVDEPALRRGE